MESKQATKLSYDILSFREDYQPLKLAKSLY